MLIFLAAFSGFVNISNAQISRSTYFLNYLPAANSLNPAFVPSGQFYFGLPVLSSTYIGVNMPVNYSGITRRSNTNDDVYLDHEQILNKLDDVSLISVNFYSSLGQVGYRFNRHVFQISVAKILTTNIYLEKELFNFLLAGNADDAYIGRNLNFSKTNVNSTLYHEFAFGYAFDLNNSLTLGIKLKYLNGEANIYTEKANVNFYTDANSGYALRASSDLELHTSSYYGYLEDIGDQDVMQYLWLDFSKNTGFAMDAGIKYNPLPDLQISASVIDLGSIKWKDNVRNYVSKYPDKEFLFEGININDYIDENSISDSIPLLDSIGDHFEIVNTSEPYVSRLVPKCYLGATYDLTRNDQFGILIKTEFYKYLTRTSYTINYKRKLGKPVSLLVNYTYVHNNHNFGLGLSIIAGPVQFYALSEGVTSFINPLYARSAYCQFGLSFMFGNH